MPETWQKSSWIFLHVAGARFTRTSLSPLFTFVLCQEMKRRQEIHVNTLPTLIAYYGQVNFLVGSQVWSVLAFLLAHNVRSTCADCKQNKTVDYRSLFKVEMAAVSQSSSASPNASGVWNRLSPEEFQQLQEYTKCKMSLFCLLLWFTKYLSRVACLV